MSVIVDNFGIDSQYVELAPGTTGPAGTGAFTLVAMYMPLSPNGAIFGTFNTDANVRAISHNSNLLFGTADFSSGFGGLTVADWFIVGESKPAGSNHYRFHQYDYTTDSSITHGESTGSANQGDGFATDAIRIMEADGAHSWGSVAWIAVWNSVLSDADFESLCTGSLQDVMALSPDALVPCNVAALTDLVDVTGNGADYVSTTGADITVGDDPPDYDFTLAAPPVTVNLTFPTETDSAFALTTTTGVTLGLPVETDAAHALTISSDQFLQLGRPIETDSAFALTISKSMAGFVKRGVDVASATTTTVTLTTDTEASVGDLVVVVHANNAFTLGDMGTPVATGTPVMNVIGDATVDGGTNHVHMKAYWYIANTAGAQTISAAESGQADEEKTLVSVILGGTGGAIDAADGQTGTSPTQEAPAVTTDAAAFLIAVVSSDSFAQQAAYTTDADLVEELEWHFGLQSGVVGTTLADAGTLGPYTFDVANNVGYGALTIAVLAGTAQPLGLPEETDTAFPLTAGIVVHLGLPVETDSAFAVFTSTGTVLGLPTETDSAIAPAYAKRFILGGGAVITLGIPVETDSAFSVTHGPVVTTIVLGLPVETDSALTLTPSGTVLLFTPPFRIMTTQMGWALRVSYPVPETVWRDANGVWQHMDTPSTELLFTASKHLAEGGRPQIVDQETANELIEAGIGTIEQIPRGDAGQWLPL